MLTLDQHEERKDVVSPEPFDLYFSDTLPNEVREPQPGEPIDLVQKQRCDGVWRTLCNLCHRTITASFEDFPENGDEDFSYDTDRTVCFEVVPCNVTVDYTLFPWDAYGWAEHWRKQKPRVFVVCAQCFAKLGVVPTQLPLTPMSPDRNFQDGDVVPSSVVEPPEDEHPSPLSDDLGDIE